MQLVSGKITVSNTGVIIPSLPLVSLRILLLVIGRNLVPHCIKLKRNVLVHRPEKIMGRSACACP